MLYQILDAQVFHQHTAQKMKFSIEDFFNKCGLSTGTGVPRKGLKMYLNVF